MARLDAEGVRAAMEFNTAGDGRAAPARLEQFEMDARARLGGLFYAAGWLLVAAATDAFQRRPWISAAVLAAFIVLGLGRFLLRPAADADGVQWQRALGWQSVLVLGSASGWCLVAVYGLSAADMAEGRVITLLCSVFLATAFAFTFPMRPRLGAAGLLLTYSPGLLLVEGGSLRVALLVYAVYLAGALARSRREYLRRLELEDELRKQRDLFRRLSQIDGLTGLFNRAELRGRLAQLFERPAEGPGRLALVMLDVDHFKSINDRFGHAEGDLVLVALAERLRLRFDSVPGAAIGRWGGEEFVVLLPAAGEIAARLAAEALLADLRARPLSDRAGVVTVSIGIGERLPRHGSPDGLLSEVDQAMYRAKADGRGCVRGLSEPWLIGAVTDLHHHPTVPPTQNR